MKKLFLLLITLVALSCKDDPVSTTEQPPRKVKYIFSGTSYSGPEKVTYLIEHNGNIIDFQTNHSYPYITDQYNLKKGDIIFVFAQNVSFISPSFIRIDLLVENDTIKTNQKTGDAPSTEISATLE